ncbi:MAG: hypothetical protein ACRDY7_13230 [Acidimicrobiia bacterium]
MRAKAASVALIATGFLGVAALPFGASGFQVADRGNGGSDSESADPECIAEEEVVIGPVCVELEDVDIISDILST